SAKHGGCAADTPTSPQCHAILQNLTHTTGFELRAWKSVPLVFTVQAAYSGRQSALPRFAKPAVGKALPFFPAGL
ncbi:hypothetical protein NKJ28_32705, partial [Mesorhizobium sp. M0145]|uniref:hypothetical protein n=1 Tax=Mesorhizobium sp. M0145 TaxID=2956895 RepID=UPI00333510BB